MTDACMYVFSIWIRTQYPVIKRRPWWNLFGRDQLVWNTSWQMVTLTDLPEGDKELILAGTKSEKGLIYRLIAEVAHEATGVETEMMNATLELGQQATQYTPTHRGQLFRLRNV